MLLVSRRLWGSSAKNTGNKVPLRLDKAHLHIPFLGISY
jgi:hypothetical protein